MADKGQDPERSGVLDAVRKYVDAVMGVTEVPRERAEKIVRELAQRGEVRARDMQKAAREIAERSTRNRQELVRLVQKEIRHQIKSLGVATRDDVDRLQRRVRDLEKKPAKAKAKPTSAKPRGTKKT